MDSRRVPHSAPAAAPRLLGDVAFALIFLQLALVSAQEIRLGHSGHSVTAGPERVDLLPVFDCNTTAETFISETNEEHCEFLVHPPESAETGSLVHFPLPAEHEVFECKLVLTIKGSHCGYFSIQYPNLDEVERITLTRRQCLDLHERMDITLSHINLNVDNRKGSVRPFNIKGRLGFNIIENNIGTTSASGSCTGERLVFRDTTYDWERAKLTFNLTLTSRTLTIPEGEPSPPGMDCDIPGEVCTYPGGTLAWKREACPAKAALTGIFYRSEDGFLRTASAADQSKLLADCRPNDLCLATRALSSQSGCIGTCVQRKFHLESSGAALSRAECGLVCNKLKETNITLKLVGPDVRSISVQCGTDMLPTSAPHYHYTTSGSFPRDDSLAAPLIKANSPALAVENKDRIRTLTEQVRAQLCRVKVEEARDILNRAHQEPTSALFIAPGELAIARGQTLIHQRCAVATATVRQTEDCFQHLPIVFKGQPFFLHSVFGHATSFARTTPCYPPPLFFVNGGWVDKDGNPQDTPVRRISSGVALDERRVSTEIGADATSLAAYGHEIDELKHRNKYVRGRLGQLIETSPDKTIRAMMGDAFDPTNLIRISNIAPLGIVAALIVTACCCCIYCRCCPGRCAAVPSLPKLERARVAASAQRRIDEMERGQELLELQLRDMMEHNRDLERQIVGRPEPPVVELEV